MTLDLEGRVALVTGAARGLGRAEALALARRGARVAIVDLLDGTEAVEAIEREGGTAVHAQVDLTRGPAAAAAALELALGAFGDLHVVVNNAGVLRDRMSFNLDDEDWDLVLGVNLSASFFLARAAARHWRERRRAGDEQPRAIVSTSSESGLYGNAGQANYAAAKAGVAALTLTLATELDRYDIRVNAIAPRARTTMAADSLGELPGGDAFDPFAPEHVAEVVAWLASDAAHDVTGQVLVVHGGGIEVMQTWTPRHRLARHGALGDDELLGLRDALFPDGRTRALAAPIGELFEVSTKHEGDGAMTTVDAAVAQWLERYGADRVPLAEVLCDAHPADATALVFDGPGGVEPLSYGELTERSKRLAGALREAGVGTGDRVAMMLPKSPELLVALLAIFRVGAVHVPLFTAFGPEAAGYRVTHSRASLVIADAACREKIADVGARMLCVGPGGAEGDLDFAEAMANGPAFDGVARGGDDLLFMFYTSGTTGQPKGVEVPIRALASMHCYMHYGVGVRPDDVYWNMGDPGWAYGLWYGVVGPLLLGQTVLLRAKPFDAEGVYAAILEHGVTNLTGAPTVYRSLRAAGVPEGFKEHSRLRAISSGGEPLNAELLAWSERELGVAIHDHYGQSELGMVVSFAQHPDLHRRPVPGSMGFSLPGYRAVVVGEDGREQIGVDGELAVDVEGSPVYWFRGYYEAPERTAERFRHGPRYYLTGDAARLDEHGLVHFASRADDVISSSGYRIGPFEVESALMAHPAVAEVAVIGTPDELRGEAVTAIVVPAPGVAGSDELAEELGQFVKARLAKHLYPRHVAFVDALPRTHSGKIRRNVLREQWVAREVGA